MSSEGIGCGSILFILFVLYLIINSAVHPTPPAVECTLERGIDPAYLQIVQMKSADRFDRENIIWYLENPSNFDNMDPPPTKEHSAALAAVADFISNSGKESMDLFDPIVFERIIYFGITIGPMPYMMIENTVDHEQHKYKRVLHCKVARVTEQMLHRRKKT
jgi:hypothetical protein